MEHSHEKPKLYKIKGKVQCAAKTSTEEELIDIYFLFQFWKDLLFNKKNKKALYITMKPGTNAIRKDKSIKSSH